MCSVRPCSAVSDSLRPLWTVAPPGSSVHGDSPGKNPVAGCRCPLQGIFPNRGIKPLVSCMGRKILYPGVTREALTTREKIHHLDLLTSLTSHSLFSCGRGEFEPQIWRCPRALLKDVLGHSVHRMLPNNFTGMNYLLVICGACKVIPFFFLKNISDDLIVLQFTLRILKALAIPSKQASLGAQTVKNPPARRDTWV